MREWYHYSTAPAQTTSPLLELFLFIHFLSCIIQKLKFKNFVHKKEGWIQWKFSNLKSHKDRCQLSWISNSSWLTSSSRVLEASNSRGNLSSKRLKLARLPLDPKYITVSRKSTGFLVVRSIRAPTLSIFHRHLSVSKFTSSKYFGTRVLRPLSFISCARMRPVKRSIQYYVRVQRLLFQTNQSQTILYESRVPVYLFSKQPSQV